MEWKIGEIKQINGEWYQCIRSILTCSSCEIPRPCTKIRELGCCSPNMRNDKEQVVFKKLEKVGEPYDFQKRTFQTYKLHTMPFLSEDVELVAIPSKDNNTIEIEIKQNKEDMEEKKLNLKPFDLQKAKAGKPVCTRDGRRARIICFDLSEEYPIAARVYDNVGNKILLFSYKKDGRINNYDYKSDLMMLSEKKEGWVNVYKEGVEGTNQYYRSTVYTNKKVALACKGSGCVATVKIEWEE